jgi:hypothetical protein
LQVAQDVFEALARRDGCHAEDPIQLARARHLRLLSLSEEKFGTKTNLQATESYLQTDELSNPSS